MEEKKIVIKRERDNKKIQAVGSKVNGRSRDTRKLTLIMGLEEKEREETMMPRDKETPIHLQTDRRISYKQPIVNYKSLSPYVDLAMKRASSINYVFHLPFHRRFLCLS